MLKRGHGRTDVRICFQTGTDRGSDCHDNWCYNVFDLTHAEADALVVMVGRKQEFVTSRLPPHRGKLTVPREGFGDK